MLIAYTKEVLWVDSWWKRRNQFGGWSHLQVSHSPVNIPAPTHSLVTLVVLMPMTSQERRKEVGRGDCWWLWRELKERTGSGYDHISLSTCMKFSRIKKSYKINNFIKQIKEYKNLFWNFLLWCLLLVTHIDISSWLLCVPHVIEHV